MTRPKRLEFKDVSSAGLQIHADLDFEAMCVEFTMKKGYQPIVHARKGTDLPLMGYEPWIQFPPKEWDEMVAQTFKEMVELWNEKYSSTGKDGQ